MTSTAIAVDTLSSPEAADVCDITYRQIDYLTRTGRVPIVGRGSGSRTRWPVDVVRVLFVASKVTTLIGDRDVEGGYSRFPFVVERLLTSVEPAELARESSRAAVLVVRPDAVVACTTSEALIEALGQRGGVVLPLGSVFDEFDERLDQLDVRREERYGRCPDCGYRCQLHRPQGGW